MYYIYGLRAKGSKEYRYVGRTADPDKRLKEHSAAGRPTGRGPALHEWLMSIGFLPLLDILESTPDLGRQMEQRWIEKLTADGHRLTNAMPASSDTSGFCERPANERRDVVTKYLDWFEEGTDEPWLKEESAVYTV